LTTFALQKVVVCERPECGQCNAFSAVSRAARISASARFLSVMSL
jgi:hypothetical protein